MEGSGEGDAKQSPNRRLKGTVVERGLVYGNLAWWQGKKADPAHTHKWTAFVRGPQNEDISFFVKKVVFLLHESFERPKRVVTHHPYEVSATGWGEFELCIRIYFVDASEKPVELFHHIRLFPPDAAPQSMKRPVIYEQYEEIVFNDPTESFYKRLTSHPSGPPIPHPLSHQTRVLFSEEDDLEKIQSGRAKINQEIERVMIALNDVDSQIYALKSEIAMPYP